MDRANRTTELRRLPSVGGLSPKPKDPFLRQLYEGNQTFHCTGMSGEGIVVVRGRLWGKLWAFRCDIRSKLAEFFEPDTQGIQDPPPPDMTFEEQRAYAKTQQTVSDPIAMKRITLHCLGKACKEFSWHPMGGPVCRQKTTPGCACSELRDPEWSCPLNKFGKEQVNGNSS